MGPEQLRPLVKMFVASSGYGDDKYVAYIHFYQDEELGVINIAEARQFLDLVMDSTDPMKRLSLSYDDMRNAIIKIMEMADEMGYSFMHGAYPRISFDIPRPRKVTKPPHVGEWKVQQNLIDSINELSAQGR